MALIVDQQTKLKHFCKICKKGFGCGRALGGHMRAHGIGDEAGHMDDDDDHVSDWEDRLDGNAGPSNKRMYALRTNPNRLKSCKACENCGKEFLSWKSFLEHGKCTSEDAESPVSSPGSDGVDDGGGGDRRGCGWSKSKRKRSMRTKVGSFNYNNNCSSNEDEDLAHCLMMLKNAIVDPDPLMAEPEESCASVREDEERRNPINFIAPLSSCRAPYENNNKAKGVAKGLFECKACKKVFNSHQALGGHRASHKKVKGCFAAKLENNNNNNNNNLEDNFVEDDAITQEEFFPTKTNPTVQFDYGNSSNHTLASSSSSKRKSKVHECSICHRSFSSGQALGGHKRCHWITSNNVPDTSTLTRFQQFQEHIDQIPKFDSTSKLLGLKLDLNYPAPTNDLSRKNNNVTTDIYLQQPWEGASITKDNKDENNNSQSQTQIHNNHDNNQVDNDNIEEDKNNINPGNGVVQNVDNEEEEDSKKLLAKLSELKEDINIDGSSSPWLQVGIGSTTNDVGTDT